MKPQCTTACRKALEGMKAPIKCGSFTTGKTTWELSRTMYTKPPEGMK